MQIKNLIFVIIFALILTAIIFFVSGKDNDDELRSDSENVSSSNDIIVPSTRITYQNYYTSDGCVEETSESVPYFLIGLDEYNLKKFFPDWEVKKFSKENITLKRKIDGMSNQHYLIGVKNGYVAVFYQSSLEGKNLKEITNTPVNSLPAEDQERLEKGIKISGEDKLFALLQDYES